MISILKFEKLIKNMIKKNINAIYIYDDEEHRDSNLYYLTGHPMDASAIIFDNGQIYLFPWDKILAQRVDKKINVIDLAGDFSGSKKSAFLYALKKEKYDFSNFVIEIDPKCSLKNYEFLKGIFNVENIKYSIFDSFWSVLDSFRMIKNNQEIIRMRNVAKITNQVINKMRNYIISAGPEIREVDLALFVESQGRLLGADGLSFETLCAGRDRSWGIHCYPAVTDSILAHPGLALIDFGFKKDGYCSDVTVPMVFEPVNEIQNKMVDTVIKAHDECIAMIKPGVMASAVYEHAVKVIKDNNLPPMPHGLGHGLGLDCHDPGGLRALPGNDKEIGRGNSNNDFAIEENFIVTVEPGIYDNNFGGCRFEDDVLVTSGGTEVLTKSRLLRFHPSDFNI